MNQNCIKYYKEELVFLNSGTIYVAHVRANLDSTIFGYNCCMLLAYVMSATQIVSA